MDTLLVEEIEMLHNRVCTALGDPKRVLLLYILANKPHNVNELAVELETPQPTISRHLSVLRERSLVKTHREGTSVVYSLADHRVIEALDLLRGLVRDMAHAQAHVADFAALDAQAAPPDED